MNELIDLADKLDRNVFEFDESPFRSSVKKLRDTAVAIGDSWSGSNLGYHATVYYVDFQPPPPGAHFSVEWGIEEVFGINAASHGNWREYNYRDVKRLIFEKAGNPDLVELTKQSDGIKDLYETAKHEIISRLTLALENKANSYLQSLLERSEKILIVSANDFARYELPSQVRSRDLVAMGQGLGLAPHQEILTSLMGLASPAHCVKELAQIARQAGSHIARMEKKSSRNKLVGTNVFIGHGHAFAWRDLKDFISDRLKLPYDEFNRIPVAGITNIARLSEMLKSAAVAFVILTAEDEQADNKMHARLNVIHEVGLFQGRLGFTKAIVLIEDGCEQFSNIEGLGQIRFPNGKISAVFEEIRRVLEREGLTE